MFIADKFYNWTYVQADPRTRDRFLMGNPIPVITICVFYVLLVKVILKDFMQKRKAFETRFLNLALNSFILTTAIYFTYKCVAIGWFRFYSWRCQPLDRSYSEDALEVVDMCYAFLMLKFTYMLETVIFMLGKKDFLVSKYHVTHHSTLPLFVWFGVNYCPGGHATFLILANSITHILLFGYFVIVTAWPRCKEYTKWWKAAFNWLHIGQFAIICIHGAQLLFWNPCHFPLVIVYFGIAYGLSLLFLFLSSWL